MIVYESLFSNTHKIAEAVGEGVRKAHPEAQVTCVRAGETGADAVKGADLVVVGGRRT